MNFFVIYRRGICQILTAGKVRSILILFGLVPLLSFGQAPITSLQTGDWDQTTTWVGGVIPGNTDNAIIASSHTVTLNAAETINDLVIESGATLRDNNKEMTVNGNFTMDGTFDGRKVLLLNGVGTWMDGFGTKTNMGNVTISSGDKTILSSAKLNFTKGRFNIENGLTVTNNGTVTIKKNIVGGDATSTWTNAANSTLNVERDLLIVGVLNASAAGNLVKYWRNKDQDIKVPSGGNYYNLELAGGGIKTLQGATNVLGHITIWSTLDVDASNNYALSISGNWKNTGTFSSQNGTVTFNGSVNQTITSTAGETFYDLTIDKTGGSLVVGQNDIVSNLLSMPVTNAGNVDATSGLLTLGTDCNNEGTLTHNSGSILGQFQRWVNTTAPGNFLFPVGTSSDVRPAIVTINTLGVCGTIIAEYVESAPGNNGLPIQDGLALPDSVRNTYVEGYWTLAAGNGFATTDYDLELIANGMTSFTPNTSTRLLTRTQSAPAWTGEGTHVSAVGDTVRRAGITFLPSQHALADTTNCKAPGTISVTGDNTVCPNSSGEAYTATFNSGSTYTWTITGGIQVGGGSTNICTVDWGSIAIVGNVRVVENNGCTDGAPADFPVTIPTIAPASITGKDNVAQFSEETYSVVSTPGYTYNWTITGGTQASGGTSSSITVDWGAAGVGNVRVIADSGICDPAPPVDLPVNIYVVIETISGGDWDDPAIWNCTCVPGDFDNIRINATHTVILTANEKITNVIIETNGILFDNNRRFDISGDLTVRGTYTGSGRLKVKGLGNTIDGTGIITTSGELRLEGGSTNIASTAILTKSPGIVGLRNGHQVVNNGDFTIGGDMTGQNADASWTNAENSTLVISGALLSTGTLVATSANNTVEYNGGTSQVFKATDYCNVSSTGTATHTLNADMVAYGNVYISAVNTLDASGFNIEVWGDWTNDGGNFIPAASTVSFKGSGTQTITKPGGEAFGNLTIDAGSAIQTGGSKDSLYISGTWTNNGTFVQQTGTVNFNGTTAQAIAGSAKTTFSNLTIDNAAGVTLSGATDIEQTLALTSGTFNTSGQDFTLISTSNATARIGQITGGDITGGIIMQRYIDSGTTGYHFITPPVSGASLGDWDQEMILSIPDGDNGLACSSNWCFWSVKYYNEGVAGVNSLGYDSLGTIGAGLGVGTGYWVYTGTGFSTTVPFTFDTRGPANKNAISLPVSYNSSGLPDDDGWNLVGNPYPSTIDWEAAGWTKAGLSDAIYVWNPNQDVFTSYIGGMGTNGGSRYVPSSQAFWVKATGAPTLAVSESVKTAWDQTFLKQSSIYSGVLKLNISGAGYKDETVIRFAAGSTNAFDVDWDAYKLPGGSSAPYIATVVGNSTDLSINSLEELSGDTVIPIRVNVKSTGMYSLYIAGAKDLPQEYCIVLEDTLLNTMTDMRTDTAIVGVSPLIDPSPRFRLHISAPLITDEIQISCSGANDGLLIADGNGIANYIWLDSNGDTLRSVTGVNGPDTLSSLGPGNYSVIVSSQSMTVCSEIIVNFEIVEPDNLTLNGQITNPVCFGDTDGEIDITIAGGTPPFSCSWNSGQTSEDLVNLGVGAYEVTIQDSNGCTIVQSYQISTPSALTSSVTVKDETCYGEGDGVIELNTNGGWGTYQYSWSNGASGPENQNLVPGAYNVTITDAYGCSDEQTGIVIQAGPQVIAGYTVPTSTVYLVDGGSLQFTNISIGGTQYVWDFGNGQSSTQMNPLYTFVAPGNYDVKLTAINGVCSSTSSNMISVSASVGIAGNDSHISGFEAFEADGLLNLYFGSPASNNVDIQIHNILGQLVCSYSDLKVGNQHVALNIKHFRSGVYIVRVIDGDINQAQKFTIK
jgi:hypothetical protein